MNDDNEDLVTEPADPMEPLSVDFNWDALYARLGEDLNDGKVNPEMVEILTRLLHVLVPDAPRHLHPGAVGLRLIALAWVLDPDYFRGRPSVKELARRCGVSAVSLARHTGHFSRLLHWRNRAQQHAWNWQPDQDATADPDDVTR